MAKPNYDPDKYDLDDMRRKMRIVCPEIVDTVSNMSNDTLANYATHLWSDVNVCEAEVSKNARKHLYEQLTAELINQVGPHLAAKALEEFTRKPILQTGPHCQLLFDKCNLFSAIFSLMGIKSFKGTFYFLSNCATTNIELRAKEGPNWVNYYDTDINVFDLPRTKRKNLSTFCLRGNLSLVMKPSFGVVNIEEANQFYNEYKPLLGKGRFSSATEAFNHANRTLWHYWHREQEFIPIFLDESFYSKLLAAHLKDESSLIHKLFNSPNLQHRILRYIESESNVPWGSMIPTQTDFLWYTAGNRIKSIKFTEDSVATVDAEINYRIDNTIKDIVNALENNRVVPNLFVIIAMVSLLPNCRLVGGLHQAAYYPALQRAFVSILDDNIEDEYTLKQYLQVNCNHAWGTHVLE